MIAAVLAGIVAVGALAPSEFVISRSRVRVTSPAPIASTTYTIVWETESADVWGEPGAAAAQDAQPAVASPAAPRVSLKATIAAIIAAQAADSITTHVALRNPNIHEVILTQSAWKNDLILGGTAAGAVALLTHAQNRKLARIAGFCLAAVHGYVAYRNLQVIRSAAAR